MDGNVQKHSIAAQIGRDCWKNETGRTSIQVLQEFFVNVSCKIASPLDHQTARQVNGDVQAVNPFKELA